MKRTQWPPEKKAPPIVDDFLGATSPETRRAPLAFQGDLLVQIAGDELWFWDAATMTRVDRFGFEYQHLCFLEDGTLVAFTYPKAAKHPEIHRIRADRSFDRLAGSIMPRSAPQLLRAGSADQVYVTERDEIVRYRLTSTRFEETARVPFPVGAQKGQVLSLGDGRLACWGAGALHILEPGKAPIEHRTPDRSPSHLAAASGGQIWYSHQTAAWNAHLVRAPITAPSSSERDVAFEPARLIHLAAAPGAVALLIFRIQAGPHGSRPPGELVWTVVVVDETGVERWRTDVPESAGAGGFVAISERRVVLRLGTHELLAWDAMTGAPISVTTR